VNARVVLIVLLASSLVAARLPGAHEPIGAPTKRLATFPVEVDGWTGKDDPFDAQVMKVVGTDDDLHRIYKKGDAYLWLYVGYYGTKKGGRTGHLPHHCYPAAGYRIVTFETLPVKMTNGRTAQVNHLVLERKGELTSTLYWIHSGEQRVLTDGWMMNMSRLRRRLLNGRDDGALVRISGPVFGTIDETVGRQMAFAQDVLETLPQHWPLERSSENL
jgi:EpsI family protein